jgi:hypothetical protein
MEIKLLLSKYDIDHLSSSRCASFVLEQKDRFSLYGGGLASEHTVIKCFDSEASLLFCDSFLEAKIIMLFYDVLHRSTILLIDENSDSNSWAVWINEPFK